MTLKHQSKTVLITGANSQLAQALQTRWTYFLAIQQQVELSLSGVHSLDIDASNINLAVGTEKPRWQLIMLDRAALDITQDAQIATAFAQYHPDWVINCAAYNQVDNAEQQQDTAYSINALGPELLAKHCAKHGARLLHISSDYVFRGDEFRCSDGRHEYVYSDDVSFEHTAIRCCKPKKGYQESDIAAPKSVYGLSKQQGEQAVFRHLGLNATVIRTAWLYARTGHNFVNTMQKLMQTSTRIEVVNNELGSPTWASALAKVCWLVIGAELGGVYHYAAQDHCSWYEFACEIQYQASTLGRLSPSCEIVPITAQTYAAKALASGRVLASRPRYSVLDSTHLYTQLMQYYAQYPFAISSIDVAELWQDWRGQLAMMFQQDLLLDTN